MDDLGITVCPVINAELSSCDAEGAVALGVVTINDLKHIIINGNGAMLSMSTLDFIAWRSSTLSHRSCHRFPYVCSEQPVSLHSLARDLSVARCPRIFLTTGKLSRLIGNAGACDILRQVWMKLGSSAI